MNIANNNNDNINKIIKGKLKEELKRDRRTEEVEDVKIQKNW